MFNAKLLFQAPGYSEWFNVKFQGDEAIYTYRLLEDYQRGNVQIIV